MEIGSIFLILALAVVIFLFITRPFFDRSSGDRLVAKPEVRQRDLQRSALLSNRDRLLNAIQELDADNELGKLPAGEYAPQREKMVLAAAETLRQLDEINLSDGRTSQTVVKSDEDELEALIAARRAGQAAQGRVYQAPQAGNKAYCTRCGKPLKSGDRFCPTCGEKVPS